MRTILVGLIAWLCFGLSTPAQAERRMFIVANDADGYGIDRCLAAGDKCGTAAANAYCKTQAFTQAATFHSVERNEVTGALPTDSASSCDNNRCDVVAIVCIR